MLSSSPDLSSRMPTTSSTDQPQNGRPDLTAGLPPVPPPRTRVERRNKHEDSGSPPRLVSNGLPPTPKVHMGACFMKVGLSYFKMLVQSKLWYMILRLRSFLQHATLKRKPLTIEFMDLIVEYFPSVVVPWEWLILSFVPLPHNRFLMVVHYGCTVVSVGSTRRQETSTFYSVPKKGFTRSTWTNCMKLPWTSCILEEPSGCLSWRMCSCHCQERPCSYTDMI